MSHFVERDGGRVVEPTSNLIAGMTHGRALSKLLQAVRDRWGHLVGEEADFWAVPDDAFRAVTLLLAEAEYLGPLPAAADGERFLMADTVRTPYRTGVWYFPKHRVLIVGFLAFLYEHDGYFSTKFVTLARSADDLRAFLRFAEDARRKIYRKNRWIIIQNDPLQIDRGGPIHYDGEDLILTQDQRGLLRELEDFLSAREWYRAKGIPWRRGVLLWGPPGNGKTQVVRMLASRMFDLGGLVYTTRVEEWVRTEMLRQAFDEAAQSAPVLFFIEDIDGLLDNTSVNRTEFLNMLDGIGRVEGIFFVATTNFPDKVDPALVNRAGRFDLTVPFPDPDLELRREFFRRRWGETAYEVHAELAARESKGLSFANLEEVCRYASLREVLDGKPLGKEEILDRIRFMVKTEIQKERSAWDGGDRKPIGFWAEAEP